MQWLTANRLHDTVACLQRELAARSSAGQGVDGNTLAPAEAQSGAEDALQNLLGSMSLPGRKAVAGGSKESNKFAQEQLRRSQLAPSNAVHITPPGLDIEPAPPGSVTPLECTINAKPTPQVKREAKSDTLLLPVIYQRKHTGVSSVPASLWAASV